MESQENKIKSFFKAMDFYEKHDIHTPEGLDAVLKQGALNVAERLKNGHVPKPIKSLEEARKAFKEHDELKALWKASKEKEITDKNK